MEPAVSGGVHHLALVLPHDAAQQLAALIEETFFDIEPAVSMHERAGGAEWGLDAYFEAAPEAALLRALVDRIAPGHPYRLDFLPPADWVGIVQKELSPVVAGRYFIYGSHDRQRASRRSGEIEIDAGQAFGTAHHGTTRGCLLALDALFKRHRFRRILDLGTGTGVLAIAAARSLRRKVLASDIDPVAVRVARDNAARNEAGHLVEALVADGLTHRRLAAGAPYDLLIANILAAPLLVLAPAMRDKTRTGSSLVLSGLLREQGPMIEARYRSFGFIINQRLPLDEWTTLVFRRR